MRALSFPTTPKFKAGHQAMRWERCWLHLLDCDGRRVGWDTLDDLDVVYDVARGVSRRPRDHCATAIGMGPKS